MKLSGEEQAVLLWMPANVIAEPAEFDVGSSAALQNNPPQVYPDLLTVLIVARIEVQRGEEPWIKVAGECLSPSPVALAVGQYESGAAIDA